jgi:hypothetical protein
MRYAKYLFLFLLMAGCSDDDDQRSNPFLVDVGFSVELNTNLPQFSNLNFNNGVVEVDNAGIRGVVVYRLNQETYLAWELSDPNRAPNNCSRLRVNGLELESQCPDDNNSYNLITGQPVTGGGRFSLKPYRAVREGSMVRVFN